MHPRWHRLRATVRGVVWGRTASARRTILGRRWKAPPKMVDRAGVGGSGSAAADAKGPGGRLPWDRETRDILPLPGFASRLPPCMTPRTSQQRQRRQIHRHWREGNETIDSLHWLTGFKEPSGATGLAVCHVGATRGFFVRFQPSWRACRAPRTLGIWKQSQCDGTRQRLPRSCCGAANMTMPRLWVSPPTAVMCTAARRYRVVGSGEPFCRIEGVSGADAAGTKRPSLDRIGVRVHRPSTAPQQEGVPPFAR